MSNDLGRFLADPQSWVVFKIECSQCGGPPDGFFDNNDLFVKELSVYSCVKAQSLGFSLYCRFCAELRSV